MKLSILALLLLVSAFAAGGPCPASVPADITNCYYIDYVGGSDSNNGTTESTPWLHAPGMTGVVNNVGPGTIDDKAGDKCPSICNYPNTGFIFKGGVTWPYQVWPMTMRLQGTGPTARVYWGVDPTWYTGAAWTRPILDFGGSANGPKCNAMVQWSPNEWVIWDNFEFTNLYWDYTCNNLTNGHITYLGVNGTHATASNNEIKNNYFHGWTHEIGPTNTTTSNVSSSGSAVNIPVVSSAGFGTGANAIAEIGVCCNTSVYETEAITAIPDSTHVTVAKLNNSYNSGSFIGNFTADACDLVNGTTQGTDIGTTFHDNVVNGVDSNNSEGYSCVALWGSPNIVYNNYFAYLANGFVGVGPTGNFEQWYQNTCTNLHFSFAHAHTQCFESNKDQGTLMYNNLFQNSPTLGIVIAVSTEATFTSYIWNNVVWNVIDNSNILAFFYPAGGMTGGTFYVFNNTMEGGVDGSNPGSLMVGCLANQTLCYYQNNFFISSANQAANCALSVTCTYAANNIAKSQALANAAGYSGASTYPFSSTLSNGFTVGAGQNLTNASPGCGTSVLTTLCTDSTVGVSLNAANNTVVVPNRPATIPRPSSGAWDVGAYNYIPPPGSISSSTGIASSSGVQ